MNVITNINYRGEPCTPARPSYTQCGNIQNILYLQTISIRISKEEISQRDLEAISSKGVNKVREKCEKFRLVFDSVRSFTRRVYQGYLSSLACQPPAL